MNIASLTNDELREELFRCLMARLEAERQKDPAILFCDRTPYAFSLSRHGNELIIDQGDNKDRLMRITLNWRHRPERDDQDAPWRAAVSRTVDQARLALSPGPEGTLDEIVENIVGTFLEQTEPAR